MGTIKRILFPVDLSTVSPKIAPQVLSMAERLDAEIHLLLVSSTLDEFSTFYVPHPSLDTFEEEMLKSARRKLEDFQLEHLEDYSKVELIVLKGDPAEEILKYIDSAKIDFVIMGTHGRKGLDRVLFGSVAEQVVKKSLVPVMSVNPFRTSETAKAEVEESNPLTPH